PRRPSRRSSAPTASLQEKEASGSSVKTGCCSGSLTRERSAQLKRFQRARMTGSSGSTTDAPLSHPGQMAPSLPENQAATSSKKSAASRPPPTSATTANATVCSFLSSSPTRSSSTRSTSLRPLHLAPMHLDRHPLNHHLPALKFAHV